MKQSKYRERREEREREREFKGDDACGLPWYEGLSLPGFHWAPLYRNSFSLYSFNCIWDKKLIENAASEKLFYSSTNKRQTLD